MKQLLIFISLLAVLTSCRMSGSLVPYRVIPISDVPDTITSSGMFYALPRQGVEVEIVVRRQEFTPGPYAEFAERLLGTRNVIRENRTVYTIDNVFVSQNVQADPMEIYFVQFNDSRLVLEYYNCLILSRVNPPQNQISERGRRGRNEQPVRIMRPNNRPIAPMINVLEGRDTVFFNQLLDTQIVQRFEIRTVQTVKTPLQRAQEAVGRIARIREDRNRLITGFHEVNYEAAAIRFMNEEFNRMENEYIRLFTGSVKVSYETVRFEFMPESRDRLTFRLAGFSADYGLQDPGVPGNQNITLNIALNDPILPDIQRFSRNAMSPKTGFRYRIPSQALVTVSLGNQLLYSRQMPFSQFGSVQSLAPDLLQIDFLPQTGEIRSIRAIEE